MKIYCKVELDQRLNGFWLFLIWEPLNKQLKFVSYFLWLELISLHIAAHYSNIYILHFFVSHIITLYISQLNTKTTVRYISEI